jgi:hypothetical protein
MSEKNTILNFNDALKELDGVSKEFFTFEVWIPSKEIYIKLKELNTKQQRLIIESVLDASVKNTFSKVFYKVMEEIWLDDISLLDELTIIDKASIAFAIRYQLSNTIKVDFKDDSLELKSIDLFPIIENFKKYIHPKNKKFDFEKNSVKVEVEISVPIFKKDLEFDSYITKHIKEEHKEDQIEEMKGILTIAFITELAKYIKEVKINDSYFNYDNLSILERIEIAENLPAVLVQNIFNEIFNIKSSIEAIYTVKNENNAKTIEIDGLLFVVN